MTHHAIYQSESGSGGPNSALQRRASGAFTGAAGVLNIENISLKYKSYLCLVTGVFHAFGARGRGLIWLDIVRVSARV
jgi:hypothetical protein